MEDRKKLPTSPTFGASQPQHPVDTASRSFIVTSKIHELYKTIQSESPASLVQQIMERPWGSREFRVTDPFGYYVRVTEPVNWEAV